jgi:hypothetical protein
LSQAPLNVGGMEHTQGYQQHLDLSTPAPWHPGVASKPRMYVVSGGQAGVDRAALDVAVAVGLRVGDWCARGRGVHESDATLVLTLGPLDGGSKLTADIARRAGKPFLVVELDAPDALPKARAWLEEVRPQVLNVAGPRGSKPPGIYARAYAFLSRALAKTPRPTLAS